MTTKTLDRKWYALSETSDGEAELSIYDEIGGFGVGARQFIEDLKTVKGRHVHLRINSPGGSVTEGINIFNALRRHQGGLTVHIDAMAASMASVIAMAGAPTYIADNAMMMVHNPWTFTMGDADELRRTADVLDKMRASLLRAYTAKTGLNADEVSTIMDDESWFDATEAVALGFADAIEEGVPAAASITPGDLRARFDSFRSAYMAKKTNPAPAAATPADEKPEIPAPLPEAPTAPADPPAPSDQPEAPEATEAPAAPEPPAAPEAPAAKERGGMSYAALAEAYDQLADAAKALRADLVIADAKINVLAAERDEAREANVAANLSITRLETLCGVRGIDTAAAIPASAPASDPVAEYEAAAERGDRAACAKIFASHKALIFAARAKRNSNQ